MSEHAESAADFTFDTFPSSSDGTPPLRSEALTVIDRPDSSEALLVRDGTQLAGSSMARARHF